MGALVVSPAEQLSFELVAGEGVKTTPVVSETNSFSARMKVAGLPKASLMEKG